MCAGPHAPVTPSSDTAPVPLCAAKQPGEGGGRQSAGHVRMIDQPPASQAPVTRAARSRARRAQKEGQPPSGSGKPGAPAPGPAAPPQSAALDASAPKENGSKPAQAVSGSISQAAIGTAQPLLIRIKQDTGDGSGQPQSALPILPLPSGASGGVATIRGDGSADAAKATGGGGVSSAQLRRSGRSTRKEGKAAGGSGGSSPATTPPLAQSGAPTAAVSGVSRTVTSLSHGGRPAGPAISSPRDLQVHLLIAKAQTNLFNRPRHCSDPFPQMVHRYHRLMSTSGIFGFKPLHLGVRR